MPPGLGLTVSLLFFQDYKAMIQRLLTQNEPNQKRPPGQLKEYKGMSCGWVQDC